MQYVAKICVASLGDMPQTKGSNTPTIETQINATDARHGVRTPVAFSTWNGINAAGLPTVRLATTKANFAQDPPSMIGPKTSTKKTKASATTICVVPAVARPFWSMIFW